jgi:PAS domain S-box-containing protein
MVPNLRKTGISIVGDMLWGTHFCCFYETPQDLLALCGPYFATGLELGEFCVWVISDPLTEEDAMRALRHAVPDLDRYLAERSIALLPYNTWYLNGGAFDLHRVITGWNEQLEHALARGYTGMRVSGDTAWLRQQDWQDFRAYEQAINESIANQHMIALCTYPLAVCGAAEVLDMARIHQCAVARRNGDWEVVELPELMQAKQEIQRLNEELEQRVIERTSELAATNEALRREIVERQQAEDDLRAQQEILQTIFDHLPLMISFFSVDGRYQLVNRAWERTRGWSLHEIQQQNVDILAESYPDPQESQRVMDFIAAATGEWADFKTRVRDGRVIDTTWASVRLADGTRIGIGQDITERKQAEAERARLFSQVRDSREQLQLLSRQLLQAQEAERRAIARELHDEIGQRLTGLGLLLSREHPSPDQLTDAQTLVRDLIARLRNLSLDLRPTILDDLGLLPALVWLFERYTMQTNVSVRFEHRLLEEQRFDPDVETTAYRIIQEALTNVARHAGVSEVTLRLWTDEDTLWVVVADQGRGFDPQTVGTRASSGLAGMQERTALLGGSLTIEAVTGGGTRLTAALPLHSGARPREQEHGA